MTNNAIVLQAFDQLGGSVNHKENDIDARWQSALPAPKDQSPLGETAEYDFERPLYRCAACIAEGELSMHKYVDECPSFDGRAAAA